MRNDIRCKHARWNLACLLSLLLSLAAPAGWAAAYVSPASITATASSQLNATRGPETVVNGSGLNLDTHVATPDGFMWHSANYGGNPGSQWIKFDLGTARALHSMQVWNHNEGGAEHQGIFGIKDAEIYVSANGTGNPVDNAAEWTLLKTVVLTRAIGAGGVKGAAYSTPDTIALLGTTSRYVAIRALSSYSDEAGSPAPGTLGLSEVVFNENLSLVNPAGFTTDQSSILVGERTAVTTVNGAGMLNDRSHSDQSTHNMWHSADFKDVPNGYAMQWMKVDLGAETALRKMLVWNHNEGGAQWQGIFGIRDAEIYTSATGNGNPIDNSAEWTLHKTVVLKRALGFPNQGDIYCSPDEIDMTGLTTRYVAIRSLSGYADVEGFPYPFTLGLSEVRFFTNPVAPQATMTFNDASFLNPTSAHMSGTVQSNEPGELKIFWGTTDGQSNPDAWTNATELPVKGLSFSRALSGLAKNTSYFARAAYVMVGATAWSPNTITFTTPNGPDGFLDMIPSTNFTAEASTILTGNRTPDRAINGAGMEGDVAGENAEGYMWHSDHVGADNINKQWFKVDLGEKQYVHSMRVWNQNEGNNAGLQGIFGVENAEIYVSESGTGNPVDNAGDWTLIDTVKFTRASVLPYNTPDSVYLNRELRHLCIRVLSTYAVGFDDTVGIAEVRFYDINAIAATLTINPATFLNPTSAHISGTLTTSQNGILKAYWGTTDGQTDADAWSDSATFAVKGGAYSSALNGLSEATTYYARAAFVLGNDMVWAPASISFQTPDGPDGNLSLVPSTNFVAEASSTLNDLRTPIHAINGDGMEGETHGEISEAEGAGFMWHSGHVGAENINKQWFKVDLGESMYLHSMRVWNHNEGNNAGLQGIFGVSDAEVYVSESGLGNPVDNPSDWTLLDTVKFTRAAVLPYNTPDSFYLNREARYISIRVLGTYAIGFDDTVGLSEVRFYTIVPNAARVWSIYE